MGCFYYLREKAKIKRKPKSEPISAISVSPSNKSDGSASTRQTNMSSGSSEHHRSLSSLYKERGQNLRVFELNELRNATNEFSRLLKIGEGGFGCVYKASIKPPNGKGSKIVAAVKKLSQNGLQGHKQWLAEVQFLGVVQHPNLVKLIGYCAVDGERGVQRLLVYEFIPNKSLEDHLFNKAIPPLPWNIRLQIALGAAEGLAYLHEELEVQVIYRDFKASNVLLDEKFKPKLSDFGLAREGPSAGNTHVSTAVMGTHGYAAPDYIETGHLTSKSDVWSFGVVLYEILTGRHSVERNRPRMEQKLLDWIKQFPVDSNNFGAIVDPRLENKYSMKGAREVAELANGCLSKHARNRPMMSEAVGRLKHAMQFTEFDGEVGIVEEESVADLGIVKSAERDEEKTVSESLRRRMLHLSKLRESVNTVGRRRLTLMKAANQT